MLARATLLLASVSSAQAALGWVKASSSNICAGVDTSCDTVESCTLTAVGPCTSAAEGAAAYLQSTFVGLAFVEDGYLEDSTKIRQVDPDESGTNGYRDFASEQTVPGQDGTEYAYTMTGGRFGDMSSVGGYIGLASYLNTGTVDIKTNEVTLHTSDDENKEYVTDQDTGSYGAPMRNLQACIAEVSGGECGDARTFVPGDYKFSIFGWTKGPNYPPAKGEYEFPNYDHIGVRMKLQAVGFEVDNLVINGNKDLTNIGDDDVETITIISGDNQLKMEFPQKYNYGTVGDGVLEVPDGTKDVSIKVSAVSGSTDSIHLDYLFEESDLNTQLRYFIYDPDVTVETDTRFSDTDGSGFSDSAASGITALFGAALAAIMMLA